MASFDLKDYLVAGGLGLGGLGLYLYSRHKRNKTGEEFKKALESLKQDVEINPKEYEKLRDVSGVDVNIGELSKPAELLMGKGNAFFSPVYPKGWVKSKYTTERVKGKDGVIALGPENKYIPTLAHELGHGKNSKEGALAKRRLKTLGWALGGGLGGLAASIIGRHLVFNSLRSGYIKPDELKWWQLAPIAASAAIGGLGSYMSDSYTIEEEEAATKNAVKFLKAYGRLPKELRKDKNLLNKALNTYRQGRTSDLLSIVGAGLASAGAGYAFYKGMER